MQTFDQKVKGLKFAFLSPLISTCAIDKEILIKQKIITFILTQMFPDEIFLNCFRSNKDYLRRNHSLSQADLFGQAHRSWICFFPSTFFLF